jgi:hypothetical protein
MFTGTPINSRTKSHKITTAYEGLKWVVNTYQLNYREMLQQAINTLNITTTCHALSHDRRFRESFQ